MRTLKHPIFSLSRLMKKFKANIDTEFWFNQVYFSLYQSFLLGEKVWGQMVITNIYKLKDS